MIDPELVAQNELTITNSSQITLTSEFDSGSIQFFPDLLGDGNDWIDFEHDVSSRISAVQTPSPIAETIAGFDVVRLGYQIPLLDIDGVSLDPGTSSQADLPGINSTRANCSKPITYLLKAARTRDSTRLQPEKQKIQTICLADFNGTGFQLRS